MLCTCLVVSPRAVWHLTLHKISPGQDFYFRRMVNRQIMWRLIRGCDWIHAKEDESTEEITQPKNFNTRVHLKYDKILICDDQTNNNEI